MASVFAEQAAWAALVALGYVQQFLIYLCFVWLTLPAIQLSRAQRIPF